MLRKMTTTVFTALSNTNDVKYVFANVRDTTNKF